MANIYIWGGVDGGGEPATVCNEVTPTGPVSSATVTNLVALNLVGPPVGLDTGNYLVGSDAGPNTATVIVAVPPTATLALLAPFSSTVALGRDRRNDIARQYRLEPAHR